MSRFKPATRTCVRPMADWWRKSPWFVRYRVREGPALWLAGYALVLLAGLACLVRVRWLSKPGARRSTRLGPSGCFRSRLFLS